MNAVKRIEQYLHKRAGLRGCDNAIHGIDCGEESEGFLYARDIEVILRQRAELIDALKACLEKGKRWHPCDPVVVKAQEAIKRAEGGK